jgi:hypothetical protein
MKFKPFNIVGTLRPGTDGWFKTWPTEIKGASKEMKSDAEPTLFPNVTESRELLDIPAEFKQEIDDWDIHQVLSVGDPSIRTMLLLLAGKCVPVRICA